MTVDQTALWYTVVVLITKVNEVKCWQILFIIANRNYFLDILKLIFYILYIIKRLI